MARIRRYDLTMEQALNLSSSAVAQYQPLSVIRSSIRNAGEKGGSSTSRSWTARRASRRNC